MCAECQQLECFFEVEYNISRHYFCVSYDIETQKSTLCVIAGTSCIVNYNMVIFLQID